MSKVGEAPERRLAKLIERYVKIESPGTMKETCDRIGITYETYRKRMIEPHKITVDELQKFYRLGIPMEDLLAALDVAIRCKIHKPKDWI